MSFDRSARAALIAACATLLVCGIGFRVAIRGADYYLAKQPAPLQRPLTTISKDLGAWRAPGDDTRLTAELEEELGTSHYLDRAYVKETESGEQTLHVHITFYTGLIDAVPHIPERCIAAHGWAIEHLPVTLDLPLDRSRWVSDPDRSNLATGTPYPLLVFSHPITGDMTNVRMPVGDLQLRTTEFRADDSPDLRIFAGYFFLANGRTASSATGVRQYAFDLTTRSAYYAKVQFTMVASREATPESFARTVADLTGELLPQLMLCLPDWAEIEMDAAAPEQ